MPIDVRSVAPGPERGRRIAIRHEFGSRGYFHRKLFDRFLANGEMHPVSRVADRNTLIAAAQSGGKRLAPDRH